MGSLSSAIRELTEATPGLNRIVIETSGSAFPATLAMEVNRLAKAEKGAYELDGVVTVIDVENWKGYEDTSVTARLQARYTDLIVFNKWELCDERKFEDALDRVGDLEVDVAWVKSNKGKVPVGVVFGVDGGLATTLVERDQHDHDHSNGHTNGESHQSEVEVLSITLRGDHGAAVDSAKLETLLRSAPKDEVYRIKAVLTASPPISSSDESATKIRPATSRRYVLNWAFGRWTSTPLEEETEEHASSSGIILRMTMILARYESTKWKKKLEGGHYIDTLGDQRQLDVVKVA